jgi:hypothetical protein
VHVAGSRSADCEGHGFSSWSYGCRDLQKDSALIPGSRDTLPEKWGNLRLDKFRRPLRCLRPWRARKTCWHMARRHCFEMAAALAAGIAKNHLFFDGNKRTALVVAMSFLELNGDENDTDEESIAVVFEQLAEGKRSEKWLSAWLEERAL